MERVEYRLRPVTRFIVTRYQNLGGGECVSSQLGEYSNADAGYDVAYALCRAEHERLGYPPGDLRIQYPRRLSDTA